MSFSLLQTVGHFLLTQRLGSSHVHNLTLVGETAARSKDKNQVVEVFQASRLAK
jgi:hypothetical protein